MCSRVFRHLNLAHERLLGTHAKGEELQPTAHGEAVASISSLMQMVWCLEEFPPCPFFISNGSLEVIRNSSCCCLREKSTVYCGRVPSRRVMLTEYITCDIMEEVVQKRRADLSKARLSLTLHVELEATGIASVFS